MDRSEAAREISKAFQSFTESDKDRFMMVCNTLLQVNYMVNRPTNHDDYDFVNKHETVFKAYFMLSGFRLILYREHRMVAVVNDENLNRFRLRKFETVVILILRILYHRKMEKITLSPDVEIDVRDIHLELQRVGYGQQDNRVAKGDLKDALRHFRRYNLINYIARDFSDDSRISIHPSIMVAVGYADIRDVLERLQSLAKGGDSDDVEDTDEDQTDQLDVL
jgi:hypothetical protein